MFRVNTLAVSNIVLFGIVLIPMVSVPILCAQSQAPKARAVSVYSGMKSYLGVGVADVTEERAKSVGLKEPQGVEVTQVTEDSPAAKAGIKQGDVILEYNGQRVEGYTQFIRMVQETPAGRKVEMQVWRSGTRQSIAAVIGSRQERPFVMTLPNAPFPPELPMIPDTPYDMFSWRSMMLGVEVEGLNSQLAEFFGVKDGVLVRSVTKGSSAETAGLKAGDIITKVGDQVVSTPRNLTPLLRKAGKDVNLTVVRNHKEITLNVKISQSFPRFEDAFPGVRPEWREIL